MSPDAVGSRLFAWLFGAGLSAEIIARAAGFLGKEIRGAIARPDRSVTRVRLQPGETYTVITRPRPSRRERRLSARQRSLAADFQRRSRPTRPQLRSARRLARTQRHLARSRPGTRRHAKLQSREYWQGIRFDRVMRPTRRQIRSAEALDAVTRDLERIRDERFEAARRSLGPRRSVTLYD